MNNWEARLTEAFDMVHMEADLKQSVRAAVREAEGQPSARPRKTLAAALCMLVLLLTGYGGYRFLQPVSVISIDINPSIELGINAFDRVVSVDAYNDGGETLSRSLALRFLKSTEAVDTVLASELIQSCLSREEKLSLTVVGDDRAENAALLNRLEDTVREVAEAECHSTPSHVVENAHPCGLSYGKYLAYLEAQAVQPELTAEQAQDMTMKEIREISGHHGGSGHGHHGNTAAPAPTEETLPATEETLPVWEETAQPAAPAHHGNQKQHHKKNHH